MTAEFEALPPLPEPEARFYANDDGEWVESSDGGTPMYTADQMRERDAMWAAKLAAAVSAEREQWREYCAAREAEVERLLALLAEAEPFLDDFADYLNTAPIWHATGGSANRLAELLPRIRAALAREKSL